MPLRRVLVVTAEPDERFSTAALRRIVWEFDARDDVEVTTFFLRTHAEPDGWGRSRVVDDLRTHPLSRMFAMVSGRLSGWFNGRRLRRWLAEVDPNVVLLDDGLGERVARSIAPRPRTVIRPNEQQPASAELEPPPLRTADLIVSASGDDPAAPDSLASSHLVDAQNLASIATSARASVREHFSVLPSERLVVGWGSDPWLDGTSLFIRTMWYLQHRHQTPVRGVWLGLPAESESFVELEMEVARCGLTGRMHFLESNDEATRLAGDAVYLPHRAGSEVGQIIDAIAGGNAVVGFAPAVLDDPSFLTVSPLDLDGAAQKLADALREDPECRSDRTKRLDVGRWVSSFIEVLDGYNERTG